MKLGWAPQWANVDGPHLAQKYVKMEFFHYNVTTFLQLRMWLSFLLFKHGTCGAIGLH